MNIPKKTLLIVGGVVSLLVVSIIVIVVIALNVRSNPPQEEIKDSNQNERPTESSNLLDILKKANLRVPTTGAGESATENASPFSVYNENDLQAIERASPKKLNKAQKENLVALQNIMQKRKKVVEEAMKPESQLSKDDLGILSSLSDAELKYYKVRDIKNFKKKLQEVEVSATSPTEDDIKELEKQDQIMDQIFYEFAREPQKPPTNIKDAFSNWIVAYSKVHGKEKAKQVNRGKTFYVDGLLKIFDKEMEKYKKNPRYPLGDLRKIHELLSILMQRLEPKHKRHDEIVNFNPPEEEDDATSFKKAFKEAFNIFLSSPTDKTLLEAEKTFTSLQQKVIAFKGNKEKLQKYEDFHPKKFSNFSEYAKSFAFTNFQQLYTTDYMEKRMDNKDIKAETKKLQELSKSLILLSASDAYLCQGLEFIVNNLNLECISDVASYFKAKADLYNQIHQLLLNDIFSKIDKEEYQSCIAQLAKYRFDLWMLKPSDENPDDRDEPINLPFEAICPEQVDATIRDKLDKNLIEVFEKSLKDLKGSDEAKLGELLQWYQSIPISKFHFCHPQYSSFRTPADVKAGEILNEFIDNLVTACNSAREYYVTYCNYENYMQSEKNDADKVRAKYPDVAKRYEDKKNGAIIRLAAENHWSEYNIRQHQFQEYLFEWKKDRVDVGVKWTFTLDPYGGHRVNNVPEVEDFLIRCLHGRLIQKCEAVLFDRKGEIGIVEADLHSYTGLLYSLQGKEDPVFLRNYNITSLIKDGLRRPDVRYPYIEERLENFVKAMDGAKTVPDEERDIWKGLLDELKWALDKYNFIPGLTFALRDFLEKQVTDDKNAYNYFSNPKFDREFEVNFKSYQKLQAECSSKTDDIDVDLCHHKLTELALALCEDYPKLETKLPSFELNLEMVPELKIKPDWSQIDDIPDGLDSFEPYLPGGENDSKKFVLDDPYSEQFALLSASWNAPSSTHHDFPEDKNSLALIMVDYHSQLFSRHPLIVLSDDVISDTEKKSFMSDLKKGDRIKPKRRPSGASANFLANPVHIEAWNSDDPVYLLLWTFRAQQVLGCPYIGGKYAGGKAKDQYSKLWDQYSKLLSIVRAQSPKTKIQWLLYRMLTTPVVPDLLEPLRGTSPQKRNLKALSLFEGVVVTPENEADGQFAGPSAGQILSIYQETIEILELRFAKHKNWLTFWTLQLLLGFDPQIMAFLVEKFIVDPANKDLMIDHGVIIDQLYGYAHQNGFIRFYDLLKEVVGDMLVYPRFFNFGEPDTGAVPARVFAKKSVGHWYVLLPSVDPKVVMDPSPAKSAMAKATADMKVQIRTMLQNWFHFSRLNARVIYQTQKGESVVIDEGGPSRMAATVLAAFSKHSDVLLMNSEPISTIGIMADPLFAKVVGTNLAFGERWMRPLLYVHENYHKLLTSQTIPSETDIYRFIRETYFEKASLTDPDILELISSVPDTKKPSSPFKDINVQNIAIGDYLGLTGLRMRSVLTGKPGRHLGGITLYEWAKLYGVNLKDDSWFTKYVTKLFHLELKYRMLMARHHFLDVMHTALPGEKAIMGFYEDDGHFDSLQVAPYSLKRFRDDLSFNYGRYYQALDTTGSLATFDYQAIPKDGTDKTTTVTMKECFLEYFADDTYGQEKCKDITGTDPKSIKKKKACIQAYLDVFMTASMGTCSEPIPIKGKDKNFSLEVTGISFTEIWVDLGDPKSSTCFRTMYIPPYSTCEQMKRALKEYNDNPPVAFTEK